VCAATAHTQTADGRVSAQSHQLTSCVRGVFGPGARRKDGVCGRETLRDFVEHTQF
jgi:hypothetical protein